MPVKRTNENIEFVMMWQWTEGVSANHHCLLTPTAKNGSQHQSMPSHWRMLYIAPEDPSENGVLVSSKDAQTATGNFSVHCTSSKHAPVCSKAIAVEWWNLI